MATKLVLGASMEYFDKANEFVRSCAQAPGCSRECIQSLLLATEEIFVNIVNHAYDDPVSGSIELVFDTIANDTVSLQFTDQGKAFNPLQVPPPDIKASIKNRKPGGLGIFMVKQLVDSVQYQRHGNSNVLTLIRHKK
jgi:anti-sigma regulatory factor (Ser/Thr protein kinase)